MANIDLLTLKATGEKKRQASNGLDITFNSVQLTTPGTSSTDVVTKSQLDSQSFVKGPVRVATTANVANLATGAPDTVDGVSVQVGDRILVHLQSSAAENGIYVVDTVGTGANGVWSRSTDMDAASDFIEGSMVSVKEGATYDDVMFVLQAAVATLGTDAVDWDQNSLTGDFANTTLSNLGTTAINANLLPDSTANNRNLGSFANKFNQYIGKQVYLSDDSAYFAIEDLAGNIAIQSYLNVAGSANFGRAITYSAITEIGYDNTRNYGMLAYADMDIFTYDNAANGSGDMYVGTGNSTAAAGSGSLVLNSGNATGTTANSGNITFTIGTATGTQGVFKMLRTGAAPSIGDVWTASAVDGTGYWAAPAAVSSVSDDTFRIQDNVDSSKELAFQVSGVTTATTRTITMSDEDINLSTGVTGSYAERFLTNNGQLSIDPDSALQTGWAANIPFMVFDGTTTEAQAAFATGIVAQGDDSIMNYIMSTEGFSSGALNTASMQIFTGYINGTATGKSGDLYIFSGDTSPSSGGGNSGLVYMKSGVADAASGNSSFGSSNGATGSGYAYLETGNATTSGNSGEIRLNVGSSTAGNSGNINMTIGTAGVTQGVFKMLRTGAAPSIGDVWTASAVDGTGYWAAPASAPTTFDDASFKVFDSVDNFGVVFDVSAATADRTITFPDTNVDLGTLATAIQRDGTVAMTGNLDLGSNKIVSLADPVNAQDAATKAYVDATATGLGVRESARLATAADLGTVTYNNGTSGVGATITNGGTQAALSIDGVAAVASDRVLVKNQVSALQNGIYTVTDIGSASTNWVLTRSSDYDGTPSGEITDGSFIFVQEGSVNSDSGWVQIDFNDATDIIGTDSISWTQFSDAGQVSAGDGLVKTGSVLSVDLATNSGLTFESADLAILLDSTSLERTASGLRMRTDANWDYGIEVTSNGVALSSLQGVTNNSGVSISANNVVVVSSFSTTADGEPGVATASVDASGSPNVGVNDKIMIEAGGVAIANTASGQVYDGARCRRATVAKVALAITAGDALYIDPATPGSVTNDLSNTSFDVGDQVYFVGNAAASALLGDATVTVDFNPQYLYEY